MVIFENIQISKYKKTMEKIENLNKRNAQGYESFAEYCIADEMMIRYFNELKTIEKKLPTLTVDSYDEFEQNTFEQLNGIYEKKINDIFERQDYSISNEEFLKQKSNKLEDLKKDILNGYGHKCDKMLDAFIEDINDKIKNYDKYEYSFLNKYSDDFDKEKEDPRLKDVMRYIMKVKEPSKSSIMEIYDLKYTRLLDILLNNGFNNVKVTQYSGDFGVDIIAYKDDIKYAIQCKKYSSPVGIKAVQEVIGSKTMNDCHVAVVLTNNYFTSSAKELAKKNNVLLWDRNKLKELIDNLHK